MENRPNPKEEEILAEIMSQFEKLKQDLGDNFDESEEEYKKGIEEMMGMSFEEMDEVTQIALKTQTIEIKSIHPDAIFPSYNYPSDSGFDLYSVEQIKLPPFGRALVPTGLQFSFGDGFEIQIRSKSGLAINQGLFVLNSPGTVDSGYSGEIKVIIFNANDKSFVIEKGMKVAQAVLCPVINGKYVQLSAVDEFEEKDRGDNGFGSTGI